MEKKDEKLTQLVNYYKNKGLAIIGLNDSQGVNVTSTFFKKGILEYIAAALQDEELRPIVINAFSLTMNKTEHIDYFLENNLSLEEIKLSQVYSVVSALEKVMKDIKLPQVFGKAGNAYRLVYNRKKGDENIFITDTLKGVEEPIVIYSSGVNNLMREIGNNPFAIKKDYERRNETPNYNYTFEKVKNPFTLNSVMDGMERNFENILSINGKSDIYTLGAYTPKSLELDGMKFFRDLVIEYNERLKQLCDTYNITFINTEAIGKEYNTSTKNFHITSAGHDALANYILSMIYINKIILEKNSSISVSHDIEIKNNGARGIYETSLNNYNKAVVVAALEKDAYTNKRKTAIARERAREAGIFLKVMENSITERQINEPKQKLKAK